MKQLYIALASAALLLASCKEKISSSPDIAPATNPASGFLTASFSVDGSAKSISDGQNGQITAATSMLLFTKMDSVSKAISFNPLVTAKFWDTLVFVTSSYTVTCTNSTTREKLIITYGKKTFSDTIININRVPASVFVNYFNSKNVPVSDSTLVVSYQDETGKAWKLAPSQPSDAIANFTLTQSGTLNTGIEYARAVVSFKAVVQNTSPTLSTRTISASNVSAVFVNSK
jgi:hypothetical protein